MRDAILFSVSANAAHGQRRTNEDKRRSVHRLLDDPEWAGWNNSKIAQLCGVGETLVASLRPKPIVPLGDDSSPPPTRTVERNGTVYQQRVRASVAPPEAPPAPPPLRYDHGAAELREKAWNAINALAEQPEPQVVIDAWMKFHGYGEPVEKIEQTISWLQAFLPLFREAEPRRWAFVEDMLARSRERRNVVTLHQKDGRIDVNGASAPVTSFGSKLATMRIYVPGSSSQTRRIASMPCSAKSSSTASRNASPNLERAPFGLPWELPLSPGLYRTIAPR